MCYMFHFIFYFQSLLLHNSPFLEGVSIEKYKNKMCVNLIYMWTVCSPLSPPTAASLVTLVSSVLVIQD